MRLPWRRREAEKEYHVRVLITGGRIGSDYVFTTAASAQDVLRHLQAQLNDGRPWIAIHFEEKRGPTGLFVKASEIAGVFYLGWKAGA